MAKKQRKANQSSQESQTFESGFVSDVNDFHLPENAWTYARNAINNSHKGDLGKLSNEFSNIRCDEAPYTIIGALHIVNDEWLIFSTNNYQSEIGRFVEGTCKYTRLVNNACLGFKQTHLIKGVVRPTFDCSFKAYWADGLNADRTMDIQNIPWVQVCTDSNGSLPGGCITCVDKLDALGRKILDCDQIRLESFIKTPKLKIKKGPSSGSIKNGSYFFQIYYLVNGLKKTDYSVMSNVVSLYTHENVNSALELTLSNLDTDFEQYEVVVTSTIADKTISKIFGQYSTSQTFITIDFLSPELPDVADEKELFLVTPVPDKSDAIYENGNYLMRVGPTEKFDFNYQPLANQIQSFWQLVEYPDTYYKNGGTNVGYMRDENYPFFIRWIYNTGDKTNSYHIPGRAATNYTLPSDSSSAGSSLLENAVCPATPNIIESGYSPKVFEVYNTAWVTSFLGVPTDDGGTLVAEGRMGYHESSEFYDDKHPERWNASAHPWSTSYANNASDFDLCGKPIRHHKFPENTIGIGFNDLTNHYKSGTKTIRVMGVAFKNVLPPVDNNGVPIKNIVGYEIMRGSRNGNKTVLYKGLINNMFEYDIPKVLNGSSRTGLYANYPFNDLNPDPFISIGKDGSGNPVNTSYENIVFGGEGNIKNYVPNNRYVKDKFTFHSPDTMFSKPFLVDDELKIYGEQWGASNGAFVEPRNHPKHKFVTDLAFGIGIIYGIGFAISKINGTKDVVWTGNKYFDQESVTIGVGSTNIVGKAVGIGAKVAPLVLESMLQASENVTSFLDGITGQSWGFASANYTKNFTQNTLGRVAGAVPGSNVNSGTSEIHYKDQNRAPGLLRAVSAIQMFTHYTGEGADALLTMVKALNKYRQHALQFQAVCTYEKFAAPKAINRRKDIGSIRYLNDGVHDFLDTHVINHLNRQEMVVLNTTKPVDNPTINDTSRGQRASSLPSKGVFNTYARRASSHYTAIKTRLRNQYSQLFGIKQLPTQSNYIDAYVEQAGVTIFNSKTGTIFGGDTYIGKYSEKNTFFYFQRWLNGEPDGAEFNYKNYQMFESTAFWMDTEPFDFGEFIQSLPNAIYTAVKNSSIGSFWNNIVTPSDKHCFDRVPGDRGWLVVKNAYIYLFNSGVKDFYCESEYNLDYRDYGDLVVQKHYPIVSDLKTMFDMNIIKTDNYYKMDRSLAVSFLPFTKFSWNTIQLNDYDPLLYSSCYTYRPRRLLWSLPQLTEYKADNWSVFLPLNNKDFKSEIVAIKSIDQTGALILFNNTAPGRLPGVNTLQTTGGDELTIGDGTLLSRDIQNIVNADKSMEYASCQSRLSVVNTPFGLYWINLNQGKIFSYAGSLKEVSLKNNKFWLNTYLPYKLLEDFPSYDVNDNPVAGIGCQTTYDNEYMLLYFCKKDYHLRKDLPTGTTVVYIGKGNFLINGKFQTTVQDPMYFKDCSWTLSFDPKSEEFISYHDWHPDLSFTGRNSFLTTKKGSIWKHNTTCQSYCNFYGVDYPFEVEFQMNSKFAVSTLRNIEFYLESYIYDANCYDRHHVLDHGFDEAVIYNSEQCSGLLKLKLNPKNSLKDIVDFPKIHINYIDILYSKEEQQCRFNQFWDITKDRGEFSNAHETIWKTEENGYIRNLNINNLDYQKNELQRKKFRHFENKVILRKIKSGNVEMLVSLALGNLLVSER